MRARMNAAQTALSRAPTWFDALDHATQRAVQASFRNRPAGIRSQAHGRRGATDRVEQRIEKIHPGNPSAQWQSGSSFNQTLQDGLTASRSESRSAVTAHNESRSIESNPGLEGLGSVGVSGGFENASSLTNATATGLSTSSGASESITLSVTHSVNKKRDTDPVHPIHQYILFTPLVNHEVFEVGHGASARADGQPPVEGEDFQTFFVHTYQHQPIPHVKLWDIDRDETPDRGRHDGPSYTSV